ncbi:MAG: dicarboxylate/amino acid:cation symporter [Armatimonadota bacterium]|nr:dicarboxylate/amino acid:cation symporter [Armatimonadota bacterium]
MAVGFALGLVSGSLFSAVGLELFIQASGLIGDLFLRALLMVVIPLIVSSLALSVAHLGDISRLSRLSALTVTYYLATNVLAVTTGMILVNLVQPGVGFRLEEREAPPVPSLKLTDLILGIVPSNPVQALAEGQTLGIIFLSLLVGTALLFGGERGAPVRKALDSVLFLTVLIVTWILKIAPIGVFGLSVRLSAEFGLQILIPLSKYVTVVILGLLLHGSIVLPLIAWIFGRTSPIRYLRHFVSALLTAFATSSSSATLPVTIECAEKAGISEEVRGFVLPLGATLNMDGTALYEAVAALFVAQVYGMTLSFSEQALVFLTANLAAIGAAGIPAGGLVTMPFVFQSVGLPLKGMALILPVDRFLDMFRTAVNVEGDIVGAAVVDRLTQNPGLVKVRGQS